MCKERKSAELVVLERAVLYELGLFPNFTERLVCSRIDRRGDFLRKVVEKVAGWWEKGNEQVAMAMQPPPTCGVDGHFLAVNHDCVVCAMLAS